MEPYYADEWATIYHADCREMLPSITADVLVSDPPYGIEFSSGMCGVLGDCRVDGDTDTTSRDAVLFLWGDRPSIVFGSWKAPRPRRLAALLVWDKGPHVGMGNLAFPWRPNHEEIYVSGRGFSGHRGTSVLRYNAISPNFVKRDHPTEKPIDLMLELIGKCPPGTILDPFMGSGTTLVAAKQLGRKSIGIEINEEYCRIAVNRLKQQVLPLSPLARCPYCEAELYEPVANHVPKCEAYRKRGLFPAVREDVG